MNLKDVLSGKLTDEEIEALNRSFEIIGDIAIIELDESLLPRKKEIADAIVYLQKNVKVVLLKTGDVGGEFRVPEFEVLLEVQGRDFSHVPKAFRPTRATETVHQENGCRFKIDPSRAYFSGKLAGERGRIRDIVQDGERVLCLFAGVGPFAIVCAKSHDISMLGVEINPDAVEFFRENIAMNKVSPKVEAVLSDAGKFLLANKEKFDRIIMPAPKNACDFLEGALAACKKGTFVHLYMFLAEEEIDGIGERIRERCQKAGYDVEVILVRKAGNIGPFNYRIVVDFKVKGRKSRIGGTAEI